MGFDVCGRWYSHAGDSFDEPMEAVVNSLLYCNMNAEEVELFVQAMDNADRLRQHLSASGQVAFMAEGSLLDRAELSDLPDYEHAVPLELADGLGEPVDTPYAGTVNGLVIPSGLTVIVGEADGGRIELMDALAHGIYNHVSGDGREHCVTVPDAVEIIIRTGTVCSKCGSLCILSGGCLEVAFYF